MLKPLLVEKLHYKIPLPVFVCTFAEIKKANEKILLIKEERAKEDLAHQNESKKLLKEVVSDLNKFKKGIKAGDHKTSLRAKMFEQFGALSDKVYSGYHDSVLPRALKVRAIFNKIANYFLNDTSGKGSAETGLPHAP